MAAQIGSATEHQQPGTDIRNAVYIMPDEGYNEFESGISRITYRGATEAGGAELRVAGTGINGSQSVSSSVWHSESDDVIKERDPGLY